MQYTYKNHYHASKIAVKENVNILVKLVSDETHLHYKLNTALSRAVIKTVSGE